MLACILSYFILSAPSCTPGRRLSPLYKFVAPSFSSLASSLFLALPARASRVLCLAILFFDISFLHVLHLVLFGSTALSAIHIFMWFFQLDSVPKISVASSASECLFWSLVHPHLVYSQPCLRPANLATVRVCA